MGLFRRAGRISAEVPPMPTTTTDANVDLVRLERLVEASVRLRARGVSFETIEQRAATDGVSLNEAIEAIDREFTDA
jgi:hypothetical protein